VLWAGTHGGTQVYQLADTAGPLVVSQQENYIYVAVPLVELSAQDPRNCTSNLEKMPSVTIVLCLLKEVRVGTATLAHFPAVVCILLCCFFQVLEADTRRN
jgi:hypothetical protein